ncbi:GNAT family N-acetyltransferase [Amycolatopsis regifaucium]|uniref:Acetyltransferase n=1 Tax=Amycolatopsis regifaucium TaxID=546365 RepID=A0A154MCY6_9PSEU|nr:GNAT family N-acetyltransferase [Amycolatopsis regifaucium]KZB81529.1 acetyltransferase [Amycolatopsis regifaucium]OKA06902.1 GNAT family N-acetyltransferase [Amycolatopsis regifaucium]SFH29181.1 Predicted N-acetyltransferase YhbS [Amycolatopsis regifaucium]
MSELEIRPARSDELKAVGELTLAAYAAERGLVEGVGYAAELVDAARRAELAELLVAVDGDGTLVGTVTIARPGTPFAELSREGELEFRMLGVHPSATGRGIGEALTRAVIERAREVGAARVVLCSMLTMERAHRLYERLGFVRMPERDWEPHPGVTLIAYRLDL